MWIGWRLVKRIGGGLFYFGMDEWWYLLVDLKYYIILVDVVFCDGQVIQWFDFDGRGDRGKVFEKLLMLGMFELLQSLLVIGWLFDLIVVLVGDLGDGFVMIEFYIVEIRE